MKWNTLPQQNGRIHYRAETDTRKLNVYDWGNGDISWDVFDVTGNILIAEGKSVSVDEAKQVAEQSAYGVRGGDLSAAVGRELDALVAERVMGWRKSNGWLVKGRVSVAIVGNPEGPVDWDDLDAPGLPCYSTDIGAAWQVAERFNEGITLFRNLWANEEWHWHCHIGGPIGGPGESWAEELTAPLAICRAALKMVKAIARIC